MPINRNKVNLLKCLVCDLQFATLIPKKINFTPLIKGEIVEVTATCMVCKNCQSTFMNTAQMNVMRRLVADTYRENHNLLTSIQITYHREELGMSQSAFARYLGVGKTSVRRWESYYIQSASKDNLIRLKCDKSH